MKISWKNIENWRSWKMRFFWGGHFEFSKTAILIFFLLHISEKPSPFIWGIIFFCTMDGFFQNLGKEGRRTFMHTTVSVTIPPPFANLADIGFWIWSKNFGIPGFYSDFCWFYLNFQDQLILCGFHADWFFYDLMQYGFTIHIFFQVPKTA